MPWSPCGPRDPARRLPSAPRALRPAGPCAPSARPDHRPAGPADPEDRPDPADQPGLRRRPVHHSARRTLRTGPCSPSAPVAPAGPCGPWRPCGPADRDLRPSTRPITISASRVRTGRTGTLRRQPSRALRPPGLRAIDAHPVLTIASRTLREPCGPPDPAHRQHPRTLRPSRALPAGPATPFEPAGPRR